MKVKRIRKLAALLCVLILATSMIGCSKKKNKEEKEIQGVTNVESATEPITPTNAVVNEEPEEESGNYFETKAELNDLQEAEVMTDLVVNANGDVECYTCIQDEKQSQVNCYTIREGKAEKKTVEWANKAIKDAGGRVVQFERGEDGHDFLFLEDYIELDKKVDDKPIIFICHRIFQNADNNTDYVEITPEKWKDQENMLTPNLSGSSAGGIKITKDDYVIYENVGDMGMFAYSLKDQKEIDMSAVNKNMSPEKYVGLPYVKDNSIYYYSTSAPDIYYYDLLTKEEKQIACDLPLGDAKLWVTEEGEIYIANLGGIYKYNENKNSWDEILPGSNKSIGSPNYYHGCFNVIEGEHKGFYVGLKSKISTEKDLVVFYQYSTEPLPEVSNELNIYSLRENKTIRSAVVEYQIAHPEIKINYEVAMPMEGEANTVDVIRTLNTELLAGKSADILILDNLPMDSYIEKGALLDLSDVISPLIQDGTILDNIANNYIKGGKIYAMPIRFIMPYYTIQKDVGTQMGSIQDITKLKETLDSALFPVRSYDSILRLFLYTYYDDFMKDPKEIDSSAFREFLEQIKTITDNMDMRDYGIERFTDSGMEYGQAYQWYVFAKDCMMQMTEKTFASTGYASDIRDFNDPVSSARIQKGAVTTINDTFMARGTVAVNSMSTNQELAKDFIKYLFSEKVQDVRNFDGFPVNAHSLDTWCKIEPTEDEHMIYSTSDHDGKNYFEFEVTSTSLEEKQELKKLMLQVVTPTFDNEILFNMIIEESVGYFTDEKTLDQAVNDTTSKINMYLAEQ